MHGLISHFKAKPGRRDDLVAAMTAGGLQIPGLRSFVIAHDLEDADAIWITEIWDSEAAHTASMDLPAIRDGMPSTMALIAEFTLHTATRPVVGTGL